MNHRNLRGVSWLGLLGLLPLFGAGLGCSPKLDGDYDGDVQLLSIAADFGPKTPIPVHVHVEGDTLTLTGAPFTRCSPKLESVRRGEWWLDFSGGNCQVTPPPPAKPFTFPEGKGLASVEGDALTADFLPPLAVGKTDVVFQLRATRTKK